MSPSPKRDAYQPHSGKLLKNDDTVLDFSSILANLYDAATKTIKVSGLKRSSSNIPIQFQEINVAASLTNKQVYRTGGATTFFRAPSDGSITIISASLSAARSAGTLTIEPSINGTAVTSAALDLTINSAVDGASAVVSPNTTNLTVTAGQKIGIQITTDGSWAPVTADLDVDLIFTPN